MTRIVFLPGLGADARQWAPQRAAFPDSVVPPWIPPRPAESLRQFAARMAVHAEVLVGSSFGGMVALEMAHVVRPRLVLLIGSATAAPPLSRWLALLAPLARWLPDAGVLTLFGPHARGSRELAAAMLRDADRRFIAWGLGAIARWSEEAPIDVPTRRLHGARDRLIPAGDADEIVAGAGHLVNLTHPTEVNRWIARQLREV